MPIEDAFLGVALPSTIKDFIFDLHDAVRRSCRLEDIPPLYDNKYREITSKYFEKTTWPDRTAVSTEVQGDEVFLSLYSEMAMRHITNKLKPQLTDHLASWHNYKNLFEHILRSSDNNLMLTTQWIYDIMQEFAYQFQGFCQFRCQAGNHNQDILNTLRSNKDAWNLPETMSILNRLVRTGKEKEGSTRGTVLQQFGYFASIELARLECLTGDYSASLAAISHINLYDRKEPFTKLPICHFNLFYHVGVSQMMLRRFTEAIDTFSAIILYVLGVLKPGAGASLREGVPKQLTRMGEKAMSLAAVLIAITPSYRVDDQVREAISAKFEDKIKRLVSGDISSASELFDAACPKFISPIVPDYNSPRNMQNEVLEHQSRTFVNEIKDYIPLLKLRSFLGLYTSIDISKLGRFTDMSEADLICLLTSYKHKTARFRSLPKASQRSIYSDLHFYIDGEVLKIDGYTGKQDQQLATERYFISGAQKHIAINAHLNETFAKLGF